MARPTPILPSRDGKRVETLDRMVAELETNHQSGVVLLEILREAARLWAEVIRRGGVVLLDPYENSGGIDEHAIARAGEFSFVGRMEQGLVDQAIYALVGTNQDDLERVAAVADACLQSLQREIVGAWAPANAAELEAERLRDPTFVTDDGNLIDGRLLTSGWTSRAAALRESLTLVAIQSRVEDQVRAATTVLDEAGGELVAATAGLEQARAELAEMQTAIASHKLADHFEALGKSERRGSHLFQFATGALLGVAVLVAWEVPSGGGWEAVVGHLAVVAAIGAGATYTARLGSLHRATADWAAGVKVQLDTFQGFLATIESPKAQERVHEEFARRVLGPPPASVGGQDAAAGLSTAQLIELASAFAVGRRGTT